jgi:hypothetical protein
VQTEVDRLIGAAHPGWTEAQVVSHRAALIGRLRDLGMVDVTQPVPGQELRIVLDASAAAFEEQLGLGK